jgi:protein MpaA
LILGGFHGDEPKGVFVARRLIDLLQAEAGADTRGCWIIVPVVNPDGYERRRRRNANGVDLNRNFPTRNWTPTSRRSRMYGGERPVSEPETRAVIKVVNRHRPSRIVTVHSIDGHRHCNNYDGPGRAVARGMGRLNGYPVRTSIGYSTPGSFGTWAGVERAIPTITLELPSHHSPRRCWEENRGALLCLS